MEDGPASFTSLGEVVATEQLLHREWIDVFASLVPETGLDSLHEGSGVTRPTAALVFDFGGEVEPVDIPQVELVRNLVDWNGLVAVVVLPPLADPVKSSSLEVCIVGQLDQTLLSPLLLTA